MPSLTREEAKMLGRRAEQPVRAPGELLAVFVPGKLVNPLNASAWGWQKRSRAARAWKDRAAAAIYEAAVGDRSCVFDFRFVKQMDGLGAKRVVFLASVFNRFDGDGLQAALKPVRDALVECGVVSGDAERDGHLWEYYQRIDRARRGVEVRVALRERP